MKRTLKTIAFGVIALSMVACVPQNNLASNGPSGQQGGQRGGNQSAQQQGPSFAQLLSEMDSNKDGKLSKTEIKGPLVNDFSKVDTDEDGFVTEGEFNNAPKPQRGGQRG